MKYLKLLLSLAALTLNVSAAEFQISWNSSPTPGVTNYVLYFSTNVLNNVTRTNSSTIRLNAGTNLTGFVSGIIPDQWQFGVTAMKDGIESDLSNLLLVEVPEPPKNLRIIALQFSGTLSNFYDVGFFKLRIP